MSRTLDELLPEKPQSRLRIYAYSVEDDAHAGQLKVGQTAIGVKKRIQQQVVTGNFKNYTIHLDESAEREDGTLFTDHQVRARLVEKGFEIEPNENGRNLKKLGVLNKSIRIISNHIAYNNS